MYNIKYMGKYTEESQLLTGKLPEGAVQFDEPDSISEIIAMGVKITIPLIIFLIILAFIRIKIWDVSLENINFIGLILSVIIAVILHLLFIVVHEILHAFSYSKNFIKEIWFKPDDYAAFVYCSEPVSKMRFIWICMCPNLILGFIPYFLWFIGVFDFNIIVSQIVIVFSIFNIMSGVGDYLNCYLTLKQVPKNGQVQSHGFHSYWYN